MVKEDLKAKLRTKRKEAKQILQQPKKANKPPQAGPKLLTLIYNRKWDQCVQVATTYPKQTERPDRMGDLPLHEACNSGAPFQIIQAIHRSYPTAISHRGFCGRLPLHYASYNKPSLHVIKYLLRNFPDGATQFDDDGRLPVHLAVVRNAPKQAIQALVAAYPKSLDIPNQYGNTPEMLARNDIVYDLLVAEKEKPRGIDQKLDLEKKLMRDWNGGSKSPVSLLSDASEEKKGTGQKQISSKTMESDGTPKRGSLSKQPLTVSDNENIPKQKTATAKQGNNKTSAPRKTTSATTVTELTKKIMRGTGKTTITSTTTTTTKRESSITRKKEFRSARNSRSLSSGRSRRTIQATHDDLIFLEDSFQTPNYKASRVKSPNSPMDYHDVIKMRKSRTKKKEIMSTNNRRKVLPSPTRQWQYPSVRTFDQPEWKRRQFTRTVV